MRQACQVRALKISAYQYRSFKISPAEIFGLMDVTSTWLHDCERLLL
jgi:hypothetical protein